MERDFIRSQITVVVDGISEQQWHAFSEAIRSLPIPPHITLIKPLSVLPLPFYQLPEALVLETQTSQAALSELANIEQWLGFTTSHQLMPANQLERWLRQWREENDRCVIGKPVPDSKGTFFRKLPAMMDMAKWLACIENLKNLTLEHPQQGM